MNTVTLRQYADLFSDAPNVKVIGASEAESKYVWEEIHVWDLDCFLAEHPEAANKNILRIKIDARNVQKIILEDDK